MSGLVWYFAIVSVGGMALGWFFLWVTRYAPMGKPIGIDRLFKSGEQIYVLKAFSTEDGVCYLMVKYKKSVRVVTLENYASATGESLEHLPPNHYKYDRSEVKLQMSKKYISFRDHLGPVGEISARFAGTAVQSDAKLGQVLDIRV